MKVNRVMIDEKGIEFSTVRLVELTSECVNDIADAVVQKMGVKNQETEMGQCKNCKHHGKEICCEWSKFGTINTPDDGYCYKWERREDG